MALPTGAAVCAARAAARAAGAATGPIGPRLSRALWRASS